MRPRFCVDADVSRIEEADKRTFATIAQFSNLVPVFVVGTKKDKVTGYRKAQYLEELMEKMDDYQEAKKIAEQKANEQAMIQFDDLRNQLSQIEHYKADGYCCLSKSKFSSYPTLAPLSNQPRRQRRCQGPAFANPRPDRRRARTSLLCCGPGRRCRTENQLSNHRMYETRNPRHPHRRRPSPP